MSINTGEADLYRVLDIKHSTECVLKLYRRKSAVKEEIIDKLSHTHNPNIAELLDKGIIRGFQYIVIPYYKNNSLGSYIEQGVRFSVAELKALIIPSIINGLKTRFFDTSSLNYQPPNHSSSLIYQQIPPQKKSKFF